MSEVPLYGDRREGRSLPFRNQEGPSRDGEGWLPHHFVASWWPHTCQGASSLSSVEERSQPQPQQQFRNYFSELHAK